MEHYRILIGGELVEAADGKRRESIDPGNGEVVATCVQAGPREAEQAVDAAARETGVFAADGRNRVVLTPRRWCQVGGKQNFPLMTVARKPGHRGERVISR